jgi:ribosomal protein L7Ae-like RNA K-turn-binding protein
MKNSTGFLGIIKKSGKLAVGEETVAAEAQTKRARLILTASDAGEYTMRRAKSLSESKGIPHIHLEETKETLGAVSGRATAAIAAICDMGMAASYAAKLNTETGQFNEIEAELTAKAERFARRKKTKEDRKNPKTGKRRQNL